MVEQLVEQLKDRARAAVERAHASLVELSHAIHAEPELMFQEHRAAELVAGWLEAAGFAVERGVAGLPTALVGRIGDGPLEIALLAEYDALPEVGHACGHNVIAATACGAAAGLAGVAGELGLRLTVLGTPAEEGGAGKQLMLDAGLFDSAHVALMNHPGPSDLLLPEVLAAQTLDIAYAGRPAHAAAFPQLGINAADALVVAQVAIGLLRQALLPTQRVHGIVTGGGEAPNIIPASTSARFMVRAGTLAELADLRDKVRRCFEAGAVASGASLELTEHVAYADMRHDEQLAELYRRNAEALGRSFAPSDYVLNRFSTDMGNVSQVLPAIHPIIGIDSAPAVNHQPGFTAAAATPAADRAIRDGAIAVAWTAIDAASEEALRARLLAR